MLLRQGALPVGLERGQAGQAEADRRNVRDVVMRPHRVHAGQRQRRRSVDRFDLAVRDGRAHHAHVPLAGKRDVGGEAALAGEQRAVLQPRHGAADELSRCGHWPRISFGRGAHGLDDVLIAGAAAQIRRQHVEQIVVADIRLALEHADRQHQEARRAEAALQAVVIHEGLLHRMQFVAVGQTLDGANFLAVGLHREHQAGAHRLAVDDHRAGAANAVLAADMGAGLPAILADGVDQRAPRLDRDGVVAAVDRVSVMVSAVMRRSLPL